MECIGWALYASGVGFVALCAIVGPFLPRVIRVLAEGRSHEAA